MTDPIFVLSMCTDYAGFLGAGKTTLLNFILSSPDHGLKVAVIENEFGSVAIDHSLVKVCTHATEIVAAEALHCQTRCY